MYSKLQLGKKYIQYYLTASNSKGHGIHSPFVFDLVTRVFNNDGQYYCYSAIEQVRAHLIEDNTVLTLEDFGAGSRVSAQKQRAVSFIAKSSLKPRKFGTLFFRLVNYFQPNNIIELGTSLGITTAYMASAKPDAKVTSFEGAGAVAALARQNVETLGLGNITIVQGNFDDTLAGFLRQTTTVDFAFVDGNHRKQPTLVYFAQLLEKSGEHTVLVFDDIHWSAEMDEAWAAIKAHPRVTLAVDLFFIGLVFLRSENKEKQHFVIRF